MTFRSTFIRCLTVLAMAIVLTGCTKPASTSSKETNVTTSSETNGKPKADPR